MAQFASWQEAAETKQNARHAVHTHPTARAMTDQEGRFDEVSSWIENEHRCVSVAEICHHYGISRTAAAELLSAVRDKGEEFESTSLVSTEACMDFGDEIGVTTTSK
mgnify:CR=1 FL=1